MNGTVSSSIKDGKLSGAAERTAEWDPKIVSQKRRNICKERREKLPGI